MITVVTGLPRSGTSLAMQLLEAAGIPPFTDGRRGADASNPQGYYEAEIVKSLPQDSAWLAQAEGHAVKVIHLLLPHLPEGPRYRVLVMERQLDAVLRSQQRMLERLGQGGAQLAEDRLKAIYTAQLQAMDHRLERLPTGTVLRLAFESCLMDPQGITTRLLHWLAAESAPDCRQRLMAVVRARRPDAGGSDQDQLRNQSASPEPQIALDVANEVC